MVFGYFFRQFMSLGVVVNLLDFYQNNCLINNKANRKALKNPNKVLDEIRSGIQIELTQQESVTKMQQINEYIDFIVDNLTYLDQNRKPKTESAVDLVITATRQRICICFDGIIEILSEADGTMSAGLYSQIREFLQIIDAKY